ncbi:hypothetical protein FOZ60_001730 [Perkinsus olseni]|uniref:EamA domain-containing protein n=2 Tax=Perkinsus olseni TaxID=32597 RepID=A0A7J6P0H3_PEROL|nr:hypothetical protein FOZ60_001730 [Perkinsus olseni]
MVHIKSGCIAWSLIANIMFGSANFLLSYCNSQPGTSPWGVVGLVWLSSGFWGFLAAIYYKFTMGTIFFNDRDVELYKTRHEQLPGGAFYSKADGSSVSVRSKLLTLAGSLFIGWSQVMMQRAFATDPQSTGPLMAVSSSDIMVVGVFCHFVYSERLTFMQAVAIVIVLTGLVIMAAFDSTVGHFLGFVYAVLGMLTFASSMLATRYTCIEGMASGSRFTGRMLMMFIMGFACCIWQWSEQGYAIKDGDDVMAMFFWPCMSGMGQFIGVIALNNALAYPSTAVVNVIVASNSIVGLVLAYFALGVVPTPAKLTGMFIVVIGVVLITVWKQDTPLTHKESILEEAIVEPLLGGGHRTPVTVAGDGGKKSSSA